MYDEDRIGPVTLKVAKWAKELKYDDIPGEVIDHTKILILDGMGCSIFGLKMEIGEIILRYANDIEGKPEAMIWGTDKKVSASLAAFVNGTSAHGTNIQDTHRSTLWHSNVVIPQALIAVAEKEALGGQDLITAYVAANEVTIRAGLSTHIAQEGGWHRPQGRGWHGVGAMGSLGASVAVGKLLGLRVEEMVQAVVLGGDQPMGVFRSTGQYMGKRFHAGKSAANGIESAYLARKGFIAGYKIFEEGLCFETGILSPVYQLDAVTKGLGEEWETMNVGVEIYPTKRTYMANLDALLHIMRTERVNFKDMEKIRVMNPLFKAPKWGDIFYAPKGATEAQNSLPYVIAAAAHDGDYWFDQLAKEKLEDPEILSFAKDRIEVVRDPELEKLVPEKFPGAVEIWTKDGRKLFKQIDFPSGERENPLSPEQMKEKFRRMSSHLLDERNTHTIIEMVEEIEKVEDVKKLTALLRP